MNYTNWVLAGYQVLGLIRVLIQGNYLPWQPSHKYQAPLADNRVPKGGEGGPGEGTQRVAKANKH